MDAETVAHGSANADHAHAHGGSSINQIRITDKSKAFIIATLLAINCLATVAMFVKWRDSERETRMQEYYLMELDAKFIAAGLKKPEESVATQLRKQK